MRASQLETILVLGVLTACGEARHNVGVLPPGGTEPDDFAHRFCNDIESIYCDTNMRCCQNDVRKYRDRAACIAARRSSAEKCVTLFFSGAAFDDGTLRVDEAALANYLERYRSTHLACTDTNEDFRPVYSGTRPEAADCTASDQDPSPSRACGPGLYCRKLDTARPDATCAPRATSGEACQSTAPAGSCGSGLYCEAENEPNVCKPVGSPGSTCRARSQCDSGNCQGGVCSSQPRPIEECAGKPVVPGNWCIGPGGWFGSTSCTADWADCNDGSRYVIECSSGASGTFRCQCFMNSVAGSAFTTRTGFCSTYDEPETMTAAARDGCGWDIQVD